MWDCVVYSLQEDGIWYVDAPVLFTQVHTAVRD